ncbi:carnitine O-acetyltransferase-like [Limulus polyphemus]|uniref:Carnitine O-acetyltransferase-like n=1 Tax=Limulus polyphemus TaxID=6850 RepID=A0ABM1B7N6_LIMPO|nr:carnitine O-acetyltransferase-like [Limulus polyphemus]
MSLISLSMIPKKMVKQMCSLAGIRRSLATMTSTSTSRKKGTMLAHQESLLQLPVPPLQASLEKYLLSVHPLLTEEEFHQTEKIVKEFGKPQGSGEKLHAMLQERARNTENWLSDWWLSSAYLEFRMPLVVHSNPAVVFPPVDFKCKDDQLKFAARVIAGALDYKMKIDCEMLPTEMAGGKPLDMMQYFKIFSTCRIPQHPADKLKYFWQDPVPPQHIIVSHNNHYFQVDVFGGDGLPLDENQLLAQLQMVVEQSQHYKDPIGVLTTQHRDSWASAYKRLCKVSPNKESVSTIQRGIFMLCLDKPMPDLGAPNRLTHASLQVIHGGGSGGNSGNRWFDKAVQFIVGEDGVLGLNFEHSPADGPPVANLMDYVMDYIKKSSSSHWLPSTNVKPPQRLKFRLSPETIDDIDEAMQDLDKMVKDLEMTVFKFNGYGKEFIKLQKLSPDSFIQMAIQLAFYRLHGQPAATYESGSIRKFLHGRTENIRSSSIESLDFCKQMMDSSSPPHVKASALRTAIDAHKEYGLQATNGHGVDRFLLGLKKLAVENGMDVPQIFLDTGYNASTHFRLSTSQVPGIYDICVSYGPLVPDGYGCCYNPRTDGIIFGLSACNSSPETHSTKFKVALEMSLMEMHDVLLTVQGSKL